VHALSRVVRDPAFAGWALPAFVGQERCAHQPHRPEQSAHPRAPFSLAALLTDQSPNERKDEHADQRAHKQQNGFWIIHILS
jgi:hypothetical protein